MMRITITRYTMQAILILVLGSTALHAQAEAEGKNAVIQENTQTQPPVKSWLELQSSGKAASSQAQPLSGPVMDQVHERYLKSFSHPVPPYFEHVQTISY